MKTLFVTSSFLFLVPFVSSAEDVTDLLKPKIDQKYQSQLQAIENQCNGKDGCETLMADMNTLASFDKSPTLEKCPGDGCPICSDSEPCKTLAIKMKPFMSASAKANDSMTKTVTETKTVQKDPKPASKKGD